MTKRKENPGKRGRKPKPASELRSGYVSLRVRPALYSATLAALKLERDRIEQEATAAS